MLRVPRVVTCAQIKRLASIQGPVVRVVESCRVPMDPQVHVSFEVRRQLWLGAKAYFEHELGERHRMAGRASITHATTGETLRSGNGVRYVRFVVGGVEVFTIPASLPILVSRLFCERGAGVTYVGYRMLERMPWQGVLGKASVFKLLRVSISAYSP